MDSMRRIRSIVLTAGRKRSVARAARVVVIALSVTVVLPILLGSAATAAGLVATTTTATTTTAPAHRIPPTTIDLVPPITAVLQPASIVGQQSISGTEMAPAPLARVTAQALPHTL